MKKFEYFQLTVSSDRGNFFINYYGEYLPFSKYSIPLLSWLGINGWELIENTSFIDSEIINSVPNDIVRTFTTEFIYTFKRALISDEKLDNHVYSNEFKYFKSMESAYIKTDIQDSQNREVYTGESGKAALKVMYEAMSYIVSVDYPTRVVFTKNMSEIRFDKNSSDEWIKYQQ